MISRLGSNTVAARYVRALSARNRAYSWPQSAAGRCAKSRMVVDPKTATPLGRRRTAVTSRSLSPISTPTPDPKAIYFLKSAELGNPGIVIPAQSLQGDVVVGLEDHGGGNGTAHVGKLAVGQQDARRGTEGEHGIAAHAQTAEPGAAPNELGNFRYGFE